MRMAITSRRRIPVKAALVNGDRKVCVEELGPAVGKERLFQSVHAEPASRVWGRRQVPDANHAPGLSR